MLPWSNSMMSSFVVSVIAYLVVVVSLSIITFLPGYACHVWRAAGPYSDGCGTGEGLWIRMWRPCVAVSQLLVRHQGSGEAQHAACTHAVLAALPYRQCSVDDLLMMRERK